MSLVQRAVAAIEYRVEAVNRPVQVVVQSELVANEPLPAADGDPWASAVLSAPWRSEAVACDRARVELVHRTEHSGLMMAAAMDHLVDGPDSTNVLAECFADLGRVTVTASLQPGEQLRLVKFVTYGWSAQRTSQALRDQVDAALTAARQRGWDGLVDEQRAYLDDFWARADVEIDGDAQIQQAVRYALLQMLQAGARAEQRAIPAKGLTGTGYDGHAFWDSETFVLPVLIYTLPEAAKHALIWRHATMPAALERAAQLGLEGAAFPWRTISGVECSGYWPAGTAAFHVNADIADAVLRYLHATGDTAFERRYGLELLAQTARLWRSLGHHDAQGRFRIDGVTGPDEYSAIADNNVFTNLMAQQNLVAAADVAERNPERARQLGIDEEEMAAWRDAAAAMVVVFDEVLGVHPQSEGYTRHEVWDFAGTTAERYPLLLHFPYFDLYRKQVVKQADLVLAMHLRGDAFTPEQKAANFAYYEALTVRDSSLSACTQAVMAAEVGHLELAYDYLTEAALMDLADLEHNTADGVHIASLAGTWNALVAGLGGMRQLDGSLRFAPQLPEGIDRLAFGIVFQGRNVRVEVTRAATSYQLVAGEAIELFHFGRPITVESGAPMRCEPSPRRWTAVPGSSPLTQPFGREPKRRGVSGTIDAGR